MSTAHRPTWDPAQARDVKGGSRQFSVRDMAAHTKLKFRYVPTRAWHALIHLGALDSQPGQTSTGEVARRDLRADLLAAEQEAQNRKRKAEGKPPIAITSGADGAGDEDAIKRRRLLQEASELDRDDDDDEGGGEHRETNEESEEESEDEDDTDELLRELEKIKRERAEEQARQEREQLASEAALLGQSPGLNTTVPGTFSVKKRWDDGKYYFATAWKGGVHDSV